MTVEEKRKKIEKHCDSGVLCNECPLNGLQHIDGCYNYCVPDDEIDRHYSILFENKTEDPIKPDYYNDTKITPFDVIDDWSLNFYLGNAIKYIKRAGKKADNSRLQDLKKVREYIDHEIQAEEASYD